MLNSISHVWEFPLVYCFSFNDPMYDISSYLTCNHQPNIIYLRVHHIKSLFLVPGRTLTYILYLPKRPALFNSGIPKISTGIYSKIDHYGDSIVDYTQQNTALLSTFRSSVSHMRDISTFLNYVMI